MKILKPMRWKEGMFLRPQHFQQYDMYLENREYSRFRSLESFGWGVMQFELDEEALSNFVFSVKGLRAVMPDGALIDVPGNAKIGGRPFDGLMQEVGRSLDVSIGVRSTDNRGPLTLDTESATTDTRFLRSEEEVYDLDAGRDPAPLEKLAYNLRIFMGDEKQDGYETLPLVRLKRTGDTTHPVQLDPGFAPPALLLAGADVLHGAARDVVERLTVVLRDLGQQRGANDPDPLILYYGLSGSLPVLKDMVQEGQVHPRTMYHELVRLAGALFFRDKQGRSAEVIPRYDHRNPAPVFLALQQLIFELSEIVVARNWRRCPGERKQDQFDVLLPNEAKQAGAQFYLEVGARDSLQRVPMLMLTARSSTPSRIAFLRENALPGVPLEAQPGSPRQLPAAEGGGTYFRLKHEEAEWTTHVAPAGELAVFLMNCPDDVSINLIVTLPEA